MSEPRKAKSKMAVMTGLLFGLLFGLFVGLLFGRFFGLYSGLVGGLVGGLCYGLLAGFIGYMLDIQPVERIDWSWSEFRPVRSLRFALIVGLCSGLVGGLVGGLPVGLYSGLVGGLVGGLLGLLYDILDIMVIVELASRVFPNEGIHRSARNAILIGLFAGLVVFLLFGLLARVAELRLGVPFGLFFYQAELLFIMLFIMLITGLSFSLIYGGLASTQHLVLRALLYRAGYIPWNYVRFLDYAADHIFLRKVGGGYIFVHGLLRDYFTALEPEQSGG